MTHVSPILTTSCCWGACGGVGSSARDAGFSGLLHALLARPLSSTSRPQGGAPGVGDWLGFLDPLANFQLKQILHNLRTSIELERRAKEQIQAARKDPERGHCHSTG